jgi:hypothetical protein
VSRPHHFHRLIWLIATLFLVAPAWGAAAWAQSRPLVVKETSRPGLALKTAPNTVSSAWEEPTLVDPTTITLSNAYRSVKLDQTRDYIVRCPAGRFDVSGKITIWGGHNVVLQDCNEYVSNPAGDWAGDLEDQTGTLWLHDVHFGGRHLTGGVQIQEPGATVVMRDVLFDRVHGSYTTNHAECIQTWAGPLRLLIDGLVCPTDYQGLFLLPNQWDNGPAPSIFDLRHVSINDTGGGYALWLGDVKGGLSAMHLNLQDVYVVPNPTKLWRGWWLWPQPPGGIWGKVIAGAPAGGGYVHATRYGATGVDDGVALVSLPRERTDG